MHTDSAARADRATVREPNDGYIRALHASDVRRFDASLSADCRCSNPDGGRADRAAFLARAARPVALAERAARDVAIRLLGDVAIIHARTCYTLAGGRPGSGRYTDVWARRRGRWWAISAHVTRG